MNKYITFTIMAMSLISLNSHAQLGSSFNYQGELLDNGSPANGDYNFKVVLFDAATGGNDVESSSVDDVPVVNGLFTLELDFGDVVYENSDQYWIDIIVTPSGGGPGEQLSPRTKLLSVPYATQSQFGTSPWDVSGTTTIYTGKNVGLGTSNPSYKLDVRTPAGINPFRVAVDNSTRMLVNNNGGTSLGVNTTPPDRGLYVHGDVKQSEDSVGMIKFMLRVNCDSTPTIMRQYNGTNVTGEATIVRNSDLTCDIDMPTDIGDFFISVTPRYINPNSERYANCQPDTGLNSTIMTCKMFSGAGNVTGGSFDIILY